jgi:hypothetical protein
MSPLRVFGISVVLIALLACLVGETFRTKGGYDSCQMFAARSVLHSGTLSAPEFYEIQRQLLHESTGKTVWQDCFFETAAGTLLPKHSVVTPLLLAPFVVLCGDRAPLVLSGLFLSLLITAILVFASRYGSIDNVAALAVILLFSQLLFSLGPIPGELLLSVCVVGAFLLVKQLPIAAGAVLAAGLFFRPTVLFLLPWLLIMSKGDALPDSLRRGSRVCFGFALLAVSYLWINHLLFGDFFTTAYHRLPEYVDGGRRFLRHPTGFELTVFLQGWQEKLIGRRCGVLLYNSFLLLLPFLVPYLCRHKGSRDLVVLVGAGLTYACLMFSYEMWHASYYGNRFVLPALALLLVPVCVLVSSWRGAFQYRERRGQ